MEIGALLDIEGGNTIQRGLNKMTERENAFGQAINNTQEKIKSHENDVDRLLSGKDIEKFL